MVYYSVLQYSSIVIDQQNESCLPSGFVGSANVVATNPDPRFLLITVEEVGPSNNGLLIYNTPLNGSFYPNFPLVSSNMLNYGLSSQYYPGGSGTGIQIQNLGNADTAVTLTYTPYTSYAGNVCTETQLIHGGQTEDQLHGPHQAGLIVLGADGLPTPGVGTDPNGA